MNKFIVNKQGVSNVLGYAFAFSICALIMIATVLITTSMIRGKANDAAALEAQSIANKVANALLDAISAKESMPDTLQYSTQVDLPLDLIGSQYYVDVTDRTVYVNTTDGQVSRSSINYNSKDIGVTLHGRVYSGGKGLTISFSQSISSTNSPDTINLDFSVGNVTNHSPVASNYYFVSDRSDNLPKAWDPPWWNLSYQYRIPIFINNTVPPELQAKYHASNLTNTSVKIILSSKEIDYKAIHIYGDYPAYAIADAVFYDPSDSVNIRPYFIDWQSSDWQKKNCKTIFYVNLSINKSTSKYIYLYYGSGIENRTYHSARNVAEFYDNFNDLSDTWNKTYDSNHVNNMAYGITNDSWANIYVVGTGYNLVDFGTRTDWWIKKFDVNGYEYKKDEGWNKTIDCSSGDEARAVAVDRDNNIYVVGYVGDYIFNTDWMIKKFDPNGNEYPDNPDGTGWNKRIDNGSYDAALSVTTDPNNNVYVVGYVTYSSTQDWMVRKYDQTGKFLWEQRYDYYGRQDCAYSVAYKNGYLYVAGFYSTVVTGGSGGNWSIKRLDANNPLTSPIDVRYSSAGKYDDRPTSITVDAAGYVYVAGYLTDSSAGKQWWIKKFDSSLTEDVVGWNKIITPPWSSSYKDDVAYSITTYKNWSHSPAEIYVYVSGSCGNSTGNHPDWMIKKFLSDNTANDGDEYLSRSGKRGWDKKFDGVNAYDEAFGIKADRVGNVYVAGYGTDIVNKTNPTNKDWWIKKFDRDGNERKGGLSIDPTVWNLSSPHIINAVNEKAGRAVLPYNEYIMTKNYRIESPHAGNESLYMIDMVMNLSEVGKNGSIIFLSQSNIIPSDPLNKAYDDSYSIKLEQRKTITSRLMLIKYISGAGTSSPIINIPTPVHRPTNQPQYVRIRAYVYMNNVTPISPFALIHCYLYDEGPTSDLFTPFDDNFSHLDTAYPVYLTGYIGIAAHGPDYHYICVDWIRVLKCAPSYQPMVTFGPMESINYVWDSHNPGNTVDRHYFDPFSPDPIYRDYINVSKDVNFTLYNIVGNTGAQDAERSVGNIKILASATPVLTITMVVGDRNGYSYPCGLEWILINQSKNKPPEQITSPSPIEIPSTIPGQFKKVQFEISIPTSFNTVNLMLKFSGISGYPIKTVAVTSISVDRDSTDTSIRITPR